VKKILVGIPLLLLVILLVFLFGTAAQTAVRIEPEVRVLGNETPIKVTVDNPHGVRRLTAYVEQNGKRERVFETTEPARRFLIARNQRPRQLEFAAGKKQAPSLQDGKARLIIEAVSNDLRAATTTIASDLEINTRPLTISADGAQHYINQGGAELVTFNVSGYWTEAGVRVGKYTFRSFPMPGERDANSSKRFSLFAYPWDVPPDTAPVVYARNPAGAEVTATFWYKVFPKQFRKRELPLDDAFLNKAVNELDPGGSGTVVDRFLRINRDMRRENNEALRELRLKSEPKLLWSGPFFRIGKVESFFADERSYLYQGKKIDQQMHLGFDLSDVQAAPVKAGNSGRVVHAGPLGIYGQCIVVDHGYGLQSIYGHMRQLDAKPGDMVQKEQVMGRSGATGLAGGDHIHYSMQVDGVQVNPIEWWDDHWIKDRILSKLPAQKQ
jgi:murein DD-endopeptidase MepM/ murein hydrolase activator NlpD